MPRKIASSPTASYHTVSDSDPSDFEPSPPPAKRARTVKSKIKTVIKTKIIESKGDLADIEDVGTFIHRSHGVEYHSISEVAKLQRELLNWFEGVREKRGMPWRKRYDHSLSLQEKGQRAYEIWVSEVMLQQTQVATVIDYWHRWMERWPTIADLAKADVEEVNAAWRGLGYYRRARSLLKGAQTVMGNAKLNGRLPRDPGDLEKEVDGVGRYTAGAITSMAYGMRAPIVDGNIHRLFTRLLAVHAPQTAPATIKFLWTAAEDLVEVLPEEKGITGDWNQALMELGSQVCKPVNPDCAACPLKPACKAYQELSEKPQTGKKECTLCAPIPGEGKTIPSVAIFPMKKEKKVSREESEIVCIVECETPANRQWLFTKRPEKGLLAGLFEPPSAPIPNKCDPDARKGVALEKVAKLLDMSLDDLNNITTRVTRYDPIPHIFSHINMTYHVLHVVLRSDSIPPSSQGIWLDEAGVESANIGTGVKKVWAQVYGSWGNFDSSSSGVNRGKSGLTSARVKAKGKIDKPSSAKTSKVVMVKAEEKVVVRKIMMPGMPQRE